MEAAGDELFGFPSLRLGPLHFNLFVFCNIPLLVLGIVQIIYAEEANGFIDSNSDFQPGTYAVGIASLIVFVFTLLMPHYGSKTTTFIYISMLPILAIVALVGTLIDGIHYAVAGYIKSCGNELGDLWGDSDFFDDVQEECFPSGISNELNGRCYCVLGAKSSCYVFREGDGFSADDCEPLIDDYGHLLLVSYSMALTIFFITWILCPLSCCTRFVLRKNKNLRSLDPVVHESNISGYQAPVVGVNPAVNTPVVQEGVVVVNPIIPVVGVVASAPYPHDTTQKNGEPPLSH